SIVWGKKFFIIKKIFIKRGGNTVLKKKIEIYKDFSGKYLLAFFNYNLFLGGGEKKKNKKKKKKKKRKKKKKKFFFFFFQKKKKGGGLERRKKKGGGEKIL
ncbi:hypothetical protein, partial [Bacillus anthracis]|uniref:hypothetical protein n=1 Tax=Bacillus anthracis TaxID=1392 RepID=UPI0018D5A0CE